MTQRQVLLGTRPPLALPWRVAAPADGLPLLMIGWRVAPELEREGGMPESVSSLLARALSRVGAMTYASSQPPTSGIKNARLLKTHGLAERIRAAVSREPKEFWLVTTREPAVARELFDDAVFSWSLQGQIVLLSRAESLMQIDRASLLGLMDPMRPLGAAQFATLSLLAVVQPGVDGDVAALVSADADVENQVITSIEAEARESGFQWTLLSEDVFADALSESGIAAMEHRLTSR